MKPLIPSETIPAATAERADQSLHDEILNRLRDHIVEGNIPDGGRIPERQLCEMLGISRTGVTMAAMSLQRAGLIRYSRGRIEILSRKAMEAASCPCYQIIKKEFEQYIDR